MTIGEKIYIFADVPLDLTAPEGYYETAVKIGDFSVKAFASSDSDFADFYYIYCFYDNGFRIYRYDSKENVIQRAPEFKLVSAEEKELVEAGFTKRFASLSTNAKVVVIALLSAVVMAVVLIVLLIVKFVNDKKAYIEDNDFSNLLFQPDFEEITVDNGGESDEKDELKEELDDEKQGK